MYFQTIQKTAGKIFSACFFQQFFFSSLDINLTIYFWNKRTMTTCIRVYFVWKFNAFYEFINRHNEKNQKTEIDKSKIIVRQDIVDLGKLDPEQDVK